MSNESESEVCDNPIPPPKIGKRQCEDEDEKEVITKKQKIDEAVEIKEIKEETDSDYLKIGEDEDRKEVITMKEIKEEIISDESEHDKKLEAKNDAATGCGPSESLDDGISDSDSHRSSGEDNGIDVLLKPSDFIKSHKTHSVVGGASQPDDLESPAYIGEEVEEKVSETHQERHETPVTVNEKEAPSKTICVRNLSYSVERTDMEDIFKDCGEVVDVRFNVDREGRFRGFGYVEFRTAEAAKKALRLDSTELLNRRMRVDIALEKSGYPPCRSNLSSSVHTGGNLQSHPHTVKGIDASIVENKPKSPATPNETNVASKTIYVRNLSYTVERSDMENIFKDCGEIVDIRLHTDREGKFKGHAHVQFATADAAQKALVFNKKVFYNRLMFVGIAFERGIYSPNRSNSTWSSSFHKDERFQSQTIPVKCSDTSLAEDKLTCAKDVKDIEMSDADAVSAENKLPETPATQKEKNAASKTICVRNLSFDVQRAEIENIFKDCGEVVDVRVHVDVEFATAEAAEKALQLDHTKLANRPVKVGIAPGEGECFPNRSVSISFQKGESFQPLTVFVIGFDTSVAEEKIKASLKAHFSPCGEITRISLPRYHDSGNIKGFAHLDFKDIDGYRKALQLDQTAIGDHWLSVVKAKPRRDYQGIGGGRGGYHVGGWDGGDYGGRAGWGRSHGAGRHWTSNTEHW